MNNKEFHLKVAEILATLAHAHQKYNSINYYTEETLKHLRLAGVDI